MPLLMSKKHVSAYRTKNMPLKCTKLWGIRSWKWFSFCIRAEPRSRLASKESIIRTTIWAVRSGVRIPVVARDFLFCKTFRHCLASTQSHIQWLPGFFLGGKAAGSLTTHLHLAPRWRLSLATPLLLHVCHHGVDEANYTFSRSSVCSRKYWGIVSDRDIVTVRKTKNVLRGTEENYEISVTVIRLQVKIWNGCYQNRGHQFWTLKQISSLLNEEAFVLLCTSCEQQAGVTSWHTVRIEARILCGGP
jgi:hypothetical protein